MFNGRIFIDGIIVLNFLVEEGICTEDAECNLRGDITWNGTEWNHRDNLLHFIPRIWESTFTGNNLFPQTGQILSC